MTGGASGSRGEDTPDIPRAGADSPAAGRHVPEPDQEHLAARPVLGDVEELLDRRKARLAGELAGDIRAPDLFDGLDDDMAVVHRVTAADFHVGVLPDADAAADAPAADALTKLPGKNHEAA